MRLGKTLGFLFIYLFIISLFYDNRLLPLQLHAKKKLIPKPIKA